MIDCVTCPGGSNSYGWYSYHRHAPLFSLSLSRLVLRQEYLFMPPLPCDSKMASFSSSWSGLFFISILIAFFSLQGDVSELTWVIAFSFLVRYCLLSLFLFLCSLFLQATNRGFLFSFFTISDVHDSYGLFVLAVKTPGLIQVSVSFCNLIWKQIIIAMSPFLPPSLPCYLNHV